MKYTFVHPQWLSNRYHYHCRPDLHELSGQRVLDIGSGNSSTSAQLDSSNTLCRLDYPATNQRYEKRPDVYGTVCCLPFPDDCHDVILLFEVLEHIECVDDALTEIRRILKPGGKLYLSVPFIYPEHDSPHDFRRYTIHGLRLLLTKQHFKLLDEQVLGNSFVVAFQLANLALLELIRTAFRRHALLGFATAPFVLVLTLLVNIVAAPFILISGHSAASFGHLVVAKVPD